MAPKPLAIILGALTISLTAGYGSAVSSTPSSNIRNLASANQHVNSCPELCSVSGSAAANWTVVHDCHNLTDCSKPLYYQFSLDDELDDDTTHSKLYACTIDDFVASKPQVLANATLQTITNAAFSYGSLRNDSSSASSYLGSLSVQIRQLLDAGFTPIGNGSRPVALFTSSSYGTAGIWIGRDIQIATTAGPALSILEGQLATSKDNNVAMQLCGAQYDVDHTFGFVAADTQSFTFVRTAVQTWAEGRCVSLVEDKTLTSSVNFIDKPASILDQSKNGKSIASGRFYRG